MTATPVDIATAGVRDFSLPSPRGPLSRMVTGVLVGDPGDAVSVEPVEVSVADPLVDEDLQLALYLCYELHYAGIAGVDEAWEWSPALLGLRRSLEEPFEAALRAASPPDPADDGEIADLLVGIVAADAGPSLSRFIETQATLDQVREFLIHRSAYQLKEADPHSWAVPRLSGPAKAALVEIQSDEYGGGDPERVHATLFGKSMSAAGLHATYGGYLDRLPAITLATVNLMSLCGLHRRLRGAIVGHLAAFEMTSSLPSRRYANGLRRLGLGADATDFFDEHVAADAVHENIALWDLAAALAANEPALRDDILFGARALVCIEARWSSHLMDEWAAGRSSLRRALAR